jgi:hypothetical protein
MRQIIIPRTPRNTDLRPSLLVSKSDSAVLTVRWLKRKVRLSDAVARVVAELAFNVGRAA